MEIYWETFNRTYPVGTRVVGQVVRREPFGVWIEAGLGFPTLLEVINFPDAHKG